MAHNRIKTDIADPLFFILNSRIAMKQNNPIERSINLNQKFIVIKMLMPVIDSMVHIVKFYRLTK
ncbi:hypothetical protein DERF_006667 [Dermatophagoides farinae]|uniref:Uncharacterized protein n=1 Tax=Dermatophagoides farinae TaxID=6954 RepID=A0A922L772_DERFA|nr:hypothetical protein DERF_006667 [Dermatophagoides farinae]